MNIPFNDPYISELSKKYIQLALSEKQITGPGIYCSKVNDFLYKHYGTETRITTSCTAALEVAMSAINLGPGDEVILPSYTFTSTANCIVQKGATPVFVDIEENLFIKTEEVVKAINKNTKAIIAVHIAGNCGDLENLKKLCEEYKLYLIEDAAQAFGSTYKNKRLGTFGDVATISFHGTKNITCGEGGCIVINNKELEEKIDIILEKGTNRKMFYEGVINKYEWIDVGGSYIPSDIIAAFLLGSLEEYEYINCKRMEVWSKYSTFFKQNQLEKIITMSTNKDCKHNAHMFYIITQSNSLRSRIISELAECGIGSAFHYVPLHSSPAGRKYGKTIGNLKHTNMVSSRLLRLPLSVHTNVNSVTEQLTTILKKQ